MQKLRASVTCGSTCLLLSVLFLAWKNINLHSVHILTPELNGATRFSYINGTEVKQTFLQAIKRDAASKKFQSVPEADLEYSLRYWMDQPIHRKLSGLKHFKPLNQTQVNEVEKFVFFTGYPRSGHSIVGSLLDAHPNIILSYAFFLFRGLLSAPGKKGSIEGLLHNKTAFFNILYEKSYHYSFKSSKKVNKGYSLDVPGMWSGRFNKRLKIIGDKSALPTTLGYSSFSPSWFKSRYEHLQECVGIPLLGIHVVRNPFDMIATHTLYKALSYSWKKKSTWSNKNKLDNRTLLRECMEFFLNKAKAVQEMIPLCGMKVFEIHIEDLVQFSRRELQRMCDFLDVECSEKYFQVCERKIYTNVSQTRDKVVWPADIRAQVEENIQKYSFFRGYTFEDSYYNPS